MLTQKVRIRNMEAIQPGMVPLAELKVMGEVLMPGEEREFEFTEETDFKIKAQLTKEGEELKKKIEKDDAAVADDRSKESKKGATESKKAQSPGLADPYPSGASRK